MKQLTTAASVVALLLMMSFNATAVTAQKKDYSQFSHRTHIEKQKLACDSCHNGKRAFGGDDFTVCTRCHKGSVWQFK